MMPRQKISGIADRTAPRGGGRGFEETRIARHSVATRTTRHRTAQAQGDRLFLLIGQSCSGKAGNGSQTRDRPAQLDQKGG